jgi:membrane associated rhomboid family serine protease
MTAPDQQADPGQDPAQAGGQASHPGQDSPPTCYRHPGRETWVSCVRCGRHACPDCLRQAAVGQQCVECVRGTGQASRQPRTVFGGRATRSATVTWTLIVINVVIFLVEVARPALLYNLGLIGVPAYTPAGPQAGVAGGQWYRLLSSAFTAPGTSLSGLGLLDLALNMWALFIVGPELERLLGPIRYLGVYLLSAVGGALMFYYLAPYGLAAGASGAIFGLFGAWFVVSRRLRLDSRGIVLLIAINLAFSFIYHNTIAWQDHIGGLITGALLTAAYAYAPRKNRVAYQVAATALLVVLMVVAVVIRNGQLHY